MTILNPPISQEHAQREYTSALRRASLRKLTNLVRHQCNDLVPGNLVLDQLDLKSSKDLGIQNVPLQQIVGSVGRYKDFDLDFTPRERASEARWMSVALAFYQGKRLSPVLLYKVGRAYFVADGNHRVSVAHAAGEESIQAHVVEIDSSRLTPEPSCQRLGFKLQEAGKSRKS